MAFTIPFANTGDKQPISQGQSADGSVSWERGFTSLYALAPQDGGKFIDRQNFNQIMFDICETIINNKTEQDGLIDDSVINVAKTWSSDKLSTELSKKGGFNKQVKLTSSGNFTAPVTGWYKITCIGGGGGGSAGGTRSSTTACVYGGGGGGAGGISIEFKKLTKNQIYSYIIGAGGSGGTLQGAGADGGNTEFGSGENSIIANGGKGGSAANGGVGGIGTFLNGTSGTSGIDFQNISAGAYASGGIGAGLGGGNSNVYSSTKGADGISNTGGGGAGGSSNKLTGAGTAGDGGNGGSGVIFVEYFDESEE